MKKEMATHDAERLQLCQVCNKSIEPQHGSLKWVKDEFYGHAWCQNNDDQIQEIRPDYYKVKLKVSPFENSPEKKGEAALECFDLIEALNMNFNLGNAQKYLFRASKKSLDNKHDLKKALTYLKRELERLAS